jgi:hypothetical protein
MNVEWQSVAALAIVLCAALYIARRAYLAVVHRRQAACGSGCSSCPATEQLAGPTVVDVQTLSESAHRVAGRS